MTFEQKKAQIFFPKYPFLIPRDERGKRAYDTNHYFWLDIPNGWQKVFFQMCEDLKEELLKKGLLEDYCFREVKNDCGSMVIADNGKCTKEVRDILKKYEVLVRYVCAECAMPAIVENRRFGFSLCENCRKKKISFKEDEEELMPRIYYKRTVIKDGKTKIENVSIEEEWERYLERNKFKFYEV